MTKQDIVRKIMEKTNLSRRKSSNAVDFILSAIKGKLAEGEDVKISGFGIFEIRNRTRRIGRNPRTGVEIPIKEGRSLKFRLGKILKKKVTESLIE
jgi:nucleoid DNA-binding protein